VIYQLDLPVYDPMADYDLLIERGRTSEKSILGHLRDGVAAAYREYKQHRGVASLMDPIEIDGDTSTVLKGLFLYTRDRRLLAHIRAEAMSKAFQGKCPMCGRADVFSLDHYLPKEKYPEFSIFFLNLIAVCHSCNTYKGIRVGTAHGGRFFHAYFDNVSDSPPLLTSKVIVDDVGVSATFSVNDDLPADVFRNATFHFNKLRLGTEYAGDASIEMLERLEVF